MIDIIMATYNGEKYLREQLDSVLNQSYTNWRLIISDDCSKDNTVGIIKEYQDKYPEKILLYENSTPSGSAQNNFFSAIRYCSADYIMFSDQDDVWLPTKIEDTFNVMKKIEKERGTETPILIHTDLKVVDENLKEIRSSLFKMMNLNYERCALNNLLVQNIVTGCTIMTNRALFTYLREIPKHAVMHDMWLALIASAFGEIGFLNKSTMLYRQHGNNSVGAKDTKSFSYILYKIFHSKEIHDNLVKQYKQAEEFGQMFEDCLTEWQLDMLESYSSFEKKNWFDKYKALKKYNLFKNSKIQVLGQIFR